MRDGLVEQSWMEKLEMRCECMDRFGVMHRPRNYTKTSVKKIPGLQIFRYFCKECSKHFGFFAKGIVPDCPVMPNSFNFTDEEKALDNKLYEAKRLELKIQHGDAMRRYIVTLEDEHQIVAEPMGSSGTTEWLGIVEWEDMEEDWHQWNHKKTGRMIPIFSGHTTLMEVNEIINPGKIIGERLNESGNFTLDHGELIYPFRVFSSGRYRFSALAEEWQN